MEAILSYLKKAWDFVLATGENYGEHRGALWAAALAYYGLFSIFPLLLFLVYLGSDVLASGEARDTLNQFLAQSLPAGVENLNNIINQTLEARGSFGLIGAVGLIWSASAVFAVLEGGLNRIWGGEPRPFLGRRLIASASILALSVAFILVLTVGQFLPLLLSQLNLEGLETLSAVLIILLLVTVIYLFFRTFPNRSVPALPALAGALFSGLSLGLARRIFDLYLDSAFNNYGAIYGSLAWVISLAIWTYLGGTLFLLGAEVGHTLEEMDAFDRWTKSG